MKQRLLVSAKVQEGDDPPENPNDLLTELESVASQLTDLIQQINRTNSTTAYAEGKTISDALAERDVLALKRTAYADLAQTASVRQDRYSKSEVKFKSTVNIPEIQKRADELAKAYREMDARIQEINWRTDLTQ